MAKTAPYSFSARPLLGQKSSLPSSLRLLSLCTETCSALLFPPEDKSSTPTCPSYSISHYDLAAPASISITSSSLLRQLLASGSLTKTLSGAVSIKNSTVGSLQLVLLSPASRAVPRHIPPPPVPSQPKTTISTHAVLPFLPGRPRPQYQEFPNPRLPLTPCLCYKVQTSGAGQSCP